MIFTAKQDIDRILEEQVSKLEKETDFSKILPITLALITDLEQVEKYGFPTRQYRDRMMEVLRNYDG